MNDSANPVGRTCVAALYRFVPLSNHEELRSPLLEEMHRLQVRGTLLLANEGINGTVAGSDAAVDALLDWLQNHPRFGAKLAGLDVKRSWTDRPPFLRAKVKLKREIVTMGVDGIDPRQSAGTYVPPQKWNALISQPDVLTIDTRNDYEVRIGRFRNAVNPGTQTFRDFPEFARTRLDPKQHKRVAMYCTGGIRCEKSTAYLRQLGFEEVYHLQGGILKYLEEVPEEQSLWEGDCFVFDERVAVNHRLQPGDYAQCHACRAPLSTTELASPEYIEGVSCPYCHDTTTTEQRERFRERQKQMALARQRGEQHLGDAAKPISAQRRAQKLAAKNAQRTESSLQTRRR